MYNVMITGAGKIGSLIACLLADSGDYEVHLADFEFAGTDVKRLLQAMPEIKTVALDVKDKESTRAYLCENKIVAVISSLPYYLNTHVAEAAKAAKAHYFDLTEDTSVTEAVKAIAKNSETAFVPQCGLAPGFISIAANSLMKEFEQCYHAKLRVGALPQRANNALQYSLTWSTDGVINEYGNPCYGIENGKPIVLKPLEGREAIQIDGCEYEAFNTSGGLGSLAELYLGKIQTLNYKTMRYPGHCEKMRLLMNDLKLNEDRETLKRILERAIPKTYQDIVIVYVTVEGIKQGELTEKSYVKKIYPEEIRGLEWSAIQVSTAAGVCAVVDLVMGQANEYHGLILQENFRLADVLANRFGRHYA
ncbi:saccharopine dehydrogenase family protein [Legionella micdadei]|uniref:L-lysine dehydrogenase n=1 Tax=Legionella micdadei TaxID=451 RepID=A0A098GEF4_LEGMI|nr:saccharopine dehydrogenase C-terminal domain-containing protein [Legionella micdadei]ARG97581.1 saccharopine dehydrogenase [Legionella micdadei]ARH00107.1 saccharopine dehydrogenase [Legionella micdadei]KTD27660.1 L-lysine dehydrogenase [Legionella micdadei]NSL17644.1 saccharopine dehydrogenase NADP-binding domain-containing protein [Legionella micdadei]CEG60854.1 L-lysine dehydrogenase [Legionella micdadei]